jgi:serine/threonine-protein kinase HipA
MINIAVLDVLLYGQPIGTLTRLPGDRILFAFTDAYIADLDRATLSLSFKDALGNLITDVRPTQTRLPVFFANLLPEGTMREYLAARAHVKPEREFFLLATLGQDLPGALEIRPADTGIPFNESLDNADQEGGVRSEAALRFSLAGVQLKFSAVKNVRGGLTIPVDGVGGSWIVKLPSTQFPRVPENEFAMMELARRVGISVPDTALVPIDEISGIPSGITAVGSYAYAIKRFDRTAERDRVHIEDFAQVFAVYPERKYDRASYRNIAEVIWTEVGETGISEFLRRLVFNMLVGNADMHLKNWSLIYTDRRRAALAPAYDFVSTIAYLADENLALTFMDSKKFSSLTLGQFERFAAKARLPTKLTLDTVRETVLRFEEVWRNPPPDIIDNNIRTAIERHLQTVPLWINRTGRATAS